jgi:alginate O-acetyltransferase complex protein AlgI
LLAYFKYSNFFVENINLFLSELGVGTMRWIAVALPIGISFLTFQKITFVVDVYRGESRPPASLMNYAIYVLMFPQLIAGPIVRYHEIDEQIGRREEGRSLRINGFYRFSLGLARKVLIADSLAVLADAAFSVDPGGLDTLTAWLGLLAYSFQIYHDFAGYSDMAIGLGRMMGFELPENFRNPYISSNITEFWRRWHMSLGRFMRDYLYIPLGGNRLSIRRTYFNLFLVFLLSGLWHGAAWTFVMWGAWHGILLVLERLFLLRLYSRIGRLLPTLLTAFFAVNAWVLFRADGFNHARDYFSALYGHNPSHYLVSASRENVVMIVFSLVLAAAAAIRPFERWQDRMLSRSIGNARVWWLVALSILLYYLSLASVLGSGFHPFIYFRF